MRLTGAHLQTKKIRYVYSHVHRTYFVRMKYCVRVQSADCAPRNSSFSNVQKALTGATRVDESLPCAEENTNALGHLLAACGEATFPHIAVKLTEWKRWNLSIPSKHSFKALINMRVHANSKLNTAVTLYLARQCSGQQRAILLQPVSTHTALA